MRHLAKVCASTLTFGALILAGSTTVSAHRINNNQQLNNQQNYQQSNPQLINQQNQSYPLYNFKNDQNQFRLGSVTKKNPPVEHHVQRPRTNHFKISHHFINHDRISGYSKDNNQNNSLNHVNNLNQNRHQNNVTTNNVVNNHQNNQNTINFSQSQMAKLARTKLGDPYVWGATGANAFDCSGFVQYLYKNGQNVTIPRTAQDQYDYEKHVSYNNIKPGNLVFFGNAPTAISHVGMYIGNGKMVDAQNRGVVIENVKAPWWNLVGCAKVNSPLN